MINLLVFAAIWTFRTGPHAAQEGWRSAGVTPSASLPILQDGSSPLRSAQKPWRMRQLREGSAELTTTSVRTSLDPDVHAGHTRGGPQ